MAAAVVGEDVFAVDAAMGVPGDGVSLERGRGGGSVAAVWAAEPLRCRSPAPQKPPHRSQPSNL